MLKSMSMVRRESGWPWAPTWLYGRHFYIIEDPLRVLGGLSLGSESDEKDVFPVSCLIDN